MTEGTKGATPTGRLLAIDHVQLAMPNDGEDAARGFYGVLLGLTEVMKPANLAARGGCWFEQAGVRLHLGIDRDFAPAHKAHPAFLVDDLDRMILRLEAGGVAIVEDEPLAGYRRCYVNDPFGNRIELMQRME
ncbi:MAG TPA: VOC family protein [Ensifer sp.]|jgi:catechol 2,3-dioxygenase-like lactoylglutathione lyase family enzyme|uniref:VOC family protein n=1 Tax=Ensifer sp. TaxID=1872086 RepID=UPI002E0D7D33|nr:VOC family protein [Ensifer sp.]